MTSLRISRGLALFIGGLLPFVELYRRRSQLGDIAMFPLWFDDVLIGAFLLYGAWRTRGDREDGRIYLAAGWAFMAGMVYGAFFGQLSSLGQPDPSGAPSVVIVTIKGVGLALAFFALWLTYRTTPHSPLPTPH